MPGVTRGDVLAIMCTGAYGHVLSSNYNGRPRPAEVMVEGSACTVVREQDRIPEWKGEVPE
jgi:diaminopimelate decarboxylase